MVNKSLSLDYMRRARIRIKILDEFLHEEDFPDVVREAQEIVELVQKAILIRMGIDPPKWHDVIDVILENLEKLPETVQGRMKTLRSSSKWLRSQREIAFYGDVDFLPIQDYAKEDAERAKSIASEYVSIWGTLTQGE